MSSGYVAPSTPIALPRVRPTASPENAEFAQTRPGLNSSHDCFASVVHPRLVRPLLYLARTVPAEGTGVGVEPGGGQRRGPVLSSPDGAGRALGLHSHRADIHGPGVPGNGVCQTSRGGPRLVGLGIAVADSAMGKPSSGRQRPVQGLVSLGHRDRRRFPDPGHKGRGPVHQRRPGHLLLTR